MSSTEHEFPDLAENVFLAHVSEVEELGWAYVAERMDRWRMCGHEGDWQDARYDLDDSWSWPDFGEPL
jgi:hypothetical protein